MVDQVNKIKILQPVNDNIRRCRDVDAKEAVNKVYDFDQPFIIGGQSNAEGAAVLPAETDAVNPNVLLYTRSSRIEPCYEPAGRTGDRWVDNKPDGNVTSPGTKFSCATTLGKAVYHLTGIKPLIVPCAIGSTSMTQWTPPSIENDLTTLFGAMTSRTRDVMKYLDASSNPVFIWYGHEGNAGEITENLADGSIGTQYILKWKQLIKDIKNRFRGAVILYAQLATHDDSNLSSNLRRAGESQRLCEYGYGDSSSIQIGWKDSLEIINFSNVVAVNADETNIVTVVDGELNLSWSGETILEGFITTKPTGTKYKLNITVSGQSQLRLMTTSGQIGSNLSAGTHDVEFDSATWNNGGDLSRGKLRFVEPSGSSAGSVSVRINYLHEADFPSIDGAYMIVTHDLPRNANPDGYHLNVTGQREVGLRYAKCYAERVLGMHWINGTGPRLSSITKPTAATVKVKFNKTIQSNSNGYGVNLASSLFRVYDDGAEKTLTSVERDPADDTAVLITCSTDNVGVVVVTYGDRAGPADATWRQGVVYDSDNMPAPQFGPVVATA